MPQRRLTYGMAFPHLNIGIPQSIKKVRKSNCFKEIHNSHVTAMYSVCKSTGKIPLKYIYRERVSIQMNCVQIPTHET